MHRRTDSAAGVHVEPGVAGDGGGGGGDGGEKGEVMVVLCGGTALEEKEVGEAPAEGRRRWGRGTKETSR